MMSIIYALTIAPLVVFYQYLYSLCLAVTGSYGWSLIALSLLSTAIYTPLKSLAFKSQEREKKIQAILAPQLLAIKAESRGAERHARLSGLYRRYGYHPIYGLRSSFGVLLQVPFLIAAYEMLKSYEPIVGLPWGIIADLSQPDGLMGGLNLLPLLMTLVNIGALYATAGFSRKERRQGLAVAALFLALLYSAPAALLIYWTSSNVLNLLLSLGGRLGLSRPSPRPKKAGKTPPETAPAAPGLTSSLATIATAVLAVLFLGLLAELRDEWISLVVIVRGGFDLSLVFPDALIFFYLLGLGLLVIRQALQWGEPGKEVVAKAFCLFLLPLLYAGRTWAWHHGLQPGDNPADITPYLNWLATAALAMVGLVAIPFNQPSTPPEDIFQGRKGGIFLAAMLNLGVLSQLFNPAALYESSPDMFSQGFSNILARQIPWLAAWLLLAGGLWLLFHRRGRLLAVAAVFLCLWALFNSLAPLRNYGPMRGFFFVGGTDSFGRPWVNLILDGVVIMLVATGLALQHRFRLTGYLLAALHLLSLALGLFCLNVWWDDRQQAAQVKEIENQTDKLDPRLFSFSATEPNIMVFIMDSFDNEHLEMIFKEEPELAQHFPGFVSYANTVAVGSSTILSMPSIYGGPPYTPQGINRRPETSRLKKYIEAVACLPRYFTNQGYHVSLLGNPPFNMHYQQSASLLERPELFSSFEELPKDYVAEWEKMIGLNRPAMEKALASTTVDDKPPAALLSLFRLAPNLLKRAVYDNGLWLRPFANERLGQREAVVLRDSAVLGLWPRVADLRSDRPTLKIIMSKLTHGPWYLPPDSLIPVVPAKITPRPDGKYTFADDDAYRQYCSERHAIRILANVFDWLRAQGIYDQTRIILVSDHNDLNWGQTIEDFRSRLALNQEGWSLLMNNNRVNGDVRYIIRPGAILLAKDFRATGELRFSPKPMSTQDVPALVCESLNACPGLEPIPSGANRIRTHVSGEWRAQAHPDNTYIYKEYTIKGEMHDVNNWSW
ncbi:MAG: YidC/Oxa1 family membrane protein insertase [Candidatus Adiutrix sp.]|jgi:hypothetical protein|nr:YidC/Oxa1 family membrane protein insertase [Candidatus Adiutrix sp.]